MSKICLEVGGALLLISQHYKPIPKITYVSSLPTAFTILKEFFAIAKTGKEGASP